MEDTKSKADEVRGEVRRLIAEVTERDEEEILDTAHFIEELEVDSLMALELMVTLDKKFKIDIPEEEFTQLRNVNETVESVLRHMAN